MGNRASGTEAQEKKSDESNRSLPQVDEKVQDGGPAGNAAPRLQLSTAAKLKGMDGNGSSGGPAVEAMLQAEVMPLERENAIFLYECKLYKAQSVSAQWIIYHALYSVFLAVVCSTYTAHLRKCDNLFGPSSYSTDKAPYECPTLTQFHSAVYLIGTAMFVWAAAPLIHSQSGPWPALSIERMVSAARKQVVKDRSARQISYCQSLTSSLSRIWQHWITWCVLHIAPWVALVCVAFVPTSLFSAKPPDRTRDMRNLEGNEGGRYSIYVVGVTFWLGLCSHLVDSVINLVRIRDADTTERYIYDELVQIHGSQVLEKMITFHKESVFLTVQMRQFSILSTVAKFATAFVILPILTFGPVTYASRNMDTEPLLAVIAVCAACVVPMSAFTLKYVDNLFQCVAAFYSLCIALDMHQMFIPSYRTYNPHRHYSVVKRIPFSLKQCCRFFFPKTTILVVHDVVDIHDAVDFLAWESARWYLIKVMWRTAVMTAERVLGVILCVLGCCTVVVGIFSIYVASESLLFNPAVICLVAINIGHAGVVMVSLIFASKVNDFAETHAKLLDYITESGALSGLSGLKATNEISRKLLDVLMSPDQDPRERSSSVQRFARMLRKNRSAGAVSNTSQPDAEAGEANSSVHIENIALRLRETLKSYSGIRVLGFLLTPKMFVGLLAYAASATLLSLVGIINSLLP